MNSRRRFSQFISEGDGISLIAAVDSPAAAAQAQDDGAEAVLVPATLARELRAIREAVAIPILFFYDGRNAGDLSDVDACVVNVSDWQGGIGLGDAVERAHVDLAGNFELAFRVDEDEQLGESLERYDPEIFILAAPRATGEERLEQILDLLPDVPAGKLAIAEVAGSTGEEIAALERAGVDAAIVDAARVADLAPESPPEI